MPSTGYLFPSSNAAVSGVWVTPENAGADDGAVASTTIAVKNTTAIHEFGTFGFSTAVVPDNATITQVQLQVEWRVTLAAGVIGILGVRARGGTTGLPIHENSAEPTTLTGETFDITAERVWVPADLRDGTLTTRLEPRNGNDADAEVYEFDYVAVQVTYTVPGGVPVMLAQYRRRWGS